VTTLSREETGSRADVTRSEDRPRGWRRALWLGIPLLVLGGAFLASTPAQSDSSVATRGATAGSAFAEVDAFVDAEMAAQRIPGLALAVVRDGRIVHMHGFGEAEESGRAISPQTPFVIGSLSKSVTALAIMQLVETGEVELDAPVVRYLPWFRVADEAASSEITVRHLLNQTSGLSTKTGRSFQGQWDTSPSALETAVRKLETAELTTPVGETHQYSTINYSVLGLIVQVVSQQSYERYVEDRIFDPLKMRHSFTSKSDAEPEGLATGHHYWFGRAAAIDEPHNRGLNPAGYLVSTAEDMGHYVIAQLGRGAYDGVRVLSSAGTATMHRAAVPAAQTDTSYGMGWFVGPVNGIPAVFHQGETFGYHANIVLIPGTDQGVVVLMNAENSQDLFFRGRMGTVAAGVASLIEGRQPPPPPSNTGLFTAYALVLGAICIQALGMLRSATNLRRRRLPSGRLGLRLRTTLALVGNLAWALVILVLLPRQLGAPLPTLAQGLPDLAYALLASGVVALGWGVTRTLWTYIAFRDRAPTGLTESRAVA
jgi:CubicO group peptidase (beta-lactamase class C family)